MQNLLLILFSTSSLLHNTFSASVFMPFYGHKFTSSYAAREEGDEAGGGTEIVAGVVTVAGTGVGAIPRCVVSLDRQSNPTRGQLSCPAAGCKRNCVVCASMSVCVFVPANPARKIVK